MENKKILIGTGIGILAIIAIVAVVLISGCVEEKPTNCSAGTNVTGCNKSCNTDSDCCGTCCGCINKNETCNVEENVVCKIPMCKCVNSECKIFRFKENKTKEFCTAESWEDRERCVDKRVNIIGKLSVSEAGFSVTTGKWVNDSRWLDGGYYLGYYIDCGDGWEECRSYLHKTVNVIGIVEVGCDSDTKCYDVASYYVRVESIKLLENNYK